MQRLIATLAISRYKQGVDVLVIDDAAAIRSRLRALVADVRGIDSVLEASNLPEARQLLAERTPDVVVLDLHLRTGHGLELLRDLKRDRSEIQVIVLTNDATDHHRRSCTALGADYFFDKSTQFEAVLQVLEREVRRRQL